MQITLLNLVLSGDNAIVIAMASQSLPERERRQAIWWGAAGAVVLRIVLAAGVVVLLSIPYLKAVGALMLMYVAIKLMTENQSHESIRQSTTLASAVWTIVIADLVMSLDNVLAIAAVTRDHFWMLGAGIAMSLPLIVWGSKLMMNMLRRFPLLIVVGAGILGFAAGEMIVSEPVVRRMLLDAHPSFHWVVPLFFTVFLLAFGCWQKLSSSRTS